MNSTTYIPPVSAERGLTNKPVHYHRGLKGNKVRKILQDELKDLSRMTSTIDCCFFRAHYLTPDYKFDMRDVSKKALFVAYIIDSVILLSCLAVFALNYEAIKHLKDSHNKPIGFTSELRAISVLFYCITIPLFTIFHHIDNNLRHLFTPGGILCLHQVIKNRLNKRRKDLANTISCIPDKRHHLVATRVISNLVLQCNLGNCAINSLLQLATLAENKCIFEDLERNGMNTLPLTSSLQSQRKLLVNMPTDHDLFRGLINNISIETIQDYLFLLSQIPAGDQRITFIPIPSNIQIPSRSTSTGGAAELISSRIGTIIKIRAYEETVEVSEKQLIIESNYFRALLSGAYKNRPTDKKVVIHTNMQYQKQLVVMLQNIHHLEQSWGDVNDIHREKCMTFFKAATTYGFDKAIFKLGTALINLSSLDTKDKVEIATTVVASNTRLCVDEDWNGYIYKFLKAEVSNKTKNDFTVWVDFAAYHGFNDALMQIGNDLKYRRKPLRPHVVFGLIKHSERFKILEKGLIEYMRKEVNQFSSSITKYLSDSESARWFYNQMNDPNSKFINVGNFRRIWEHKEWMKHQEVKEALLNFAVHSIHLRMIINSWPQGEAPRELIEFVETSAFT